MATVSNVERCVVCNCDWIFMCAGYLLHCSGCEDHAADGAAAGSGNVRAVLAGDYCWHG